MALTPRQEAFAQAVVRNGGDKVAAYKEAGYTWENMNQNSLSVSADKTYNKANVNLRIKQLLEIANKTAEKKFSITVEQRLKWLKEITEAGISSYQDGSGVTRRENLAASRAAIQTMNDMLGVTEKGDGVKPVKVIIGVKDASRS